MIYSDGTKTRIRQDKVFTIRRNGSFIDVQWQKNGEWMRISILEDDLKNLIAMSDSKAECGALISYDEDIE